MTESTERWFVSEGHAVSFSIRQASIFWHSIDYTHINDGEVLVFKDESDTYGVRYFEKRDGNLIILKGKKKSEAKSYLTEGEKVVKVLSQPGEYRNKEDLKIWITMYSGPNGKKYTITKLTFTSKEVADDFNPPLSLGKEVMDLEEWSGYTLWNKLVS